MITLLPALIAAAIGVQAAPLESVLDTLQPYITEAQEAFPDCADNLKRVVIVPEIVDEGGDEVLGLYRNRKIYFSGQIVLASKELQQHLVFHEFAHCAAGHDAGGVFTESQAEAAVAVKLFYLPPGLTSIGGVTTYIAPRWELAL